MAKRPKRPNYPPKKRKPNSGGREDSRVLSPETKATLDRIFSASKKT